jgi:probable rRNA maturation factor
MSEEPPSPEFEIAVVAQDPAWREILNEPEEVARRAARAAFRHPGATGLGLTARKSLQSDDRHGPAELAVVLADDRLVRRLNREYRGQDAATNVLSFAGLDGPDEPGAGAPYLLGDVVLARETVVREAREQGKTPADHLAHLVVHGVLHLLGYDHQTAAQAETMENLERAALAELGVADPYLDPGRAGPPGPGCEALS